MPQENGHRAAASFTHSSPQSAGRRSSFHARNQAAGVMSAGFRPGLKDMQMCCWSYIYFTREGSA